MEREFQIIEGLDWPLDVCRAWRELTDDNPDANHAQTFQWNRACVEQLGFRAESVLLVVARLGEQIEALFPFIVEVQRLLGLKLRVLRLPRHLHIDLHDVALRPGIDHRELISDLFGFLKAGRRLPCDVIDFGRILEKSAVYELLSSELTVRSVLIPRRVCNCLPVMSEDQLRKHVSRNMRANLRKAQKVLDTYDRVRFRTTRDPESLSYAFEQFMEVEASGWKGASGTGTAILLDAKLQAFYRQLMETFGQDGRCEINQLQIDGRTAAAQFALIAGDTLYLLKIGYDQHFVDVAPGQLLLAHTVSRLHADGGIETINLITDAAWHDRWRPTALAVYEAKCYGDSLRGAIAHVYRRLRVDLGKWRRSIRTIAKRGGA